MLDLSRLSHGQIASLEISAAALPDAVKTLIQTVYPDFQKDADSLKELYKTEIKNHGFFQDSAHGVADREVLRVFDKAKNDATYLRVKGNQPLSEHPEIKKLLAADHIKPHYKDFKAIEAYYNELNAIRTQAIEQYYAEAAAVVKKTLEAKKKLFATPEGKQALLAAYDAAEGHQKWGWFTDAAKEAATVPELMMSHHASPADFLKALQGQADNHGLNRMVNQAIELSYIEGRPLADVMKERLLASGITEFQADIFSKLTHAFEQGTHVDHLQQLKAEFGAAADALHTEREAAFAATIERAGRPAGEAAGAGRTAAQAEHAAAEEAGGIMAGFNKLSHGSRWVLGGGAAALVAGGVGYWVYQQAQRDKEKAAAQESKPVGR